MESRFQSPSSSGSAAPFYRIGIDIGGTKIAIGLADVDNEILSWVSIATRDRLGKENVIRRILDQIEHLLIKHHFTAEQLAAVGLGFPGELDPITGLVKTAPNNPGFIGCDPGLLLREALQARFGIRLPVYVDNDASVAALAEAKLGAGKYVKRQLYLTVSTDIGGARFDGNYAFNIEPGLFIFPDPDQPDIPFLELGGGLPAAKKAKTKLRDFIHQYGAENLSRLTKLFALVDVPGETPDEKIENLTAEMLGHASNKGDQFAREIFIQNARQVANGLAILLSEGFREEKVILGGSVATKVPYYLDSVKTVLKTLQNNQTANSYFRDFDIDNGVVLADICDERGVLGAILYTQRNKPELGPIEILIIGASSLVGNSIIDHFAKRYRVLGTYHTNSQLGLTKLDITVRDDIAKLLSKIHPRIVVHAASLVDSDYCEEHPEEALEVNVEGTRNIVEACQQLGCQLVFISTDFVSNGQDERYSKKKTSEPINVYGKSKLAAEEIVSNTLKDYLILRILLDLRNQSKIHLKLLRGSKKGIRISFPFNSFTNPINKKELGEVLEQLISMLGA